MADNVKNIIGEEMGSGYISQEKLEGLLLDLFGRQIEVFVFNHLIY